VAGKLPDESFSTAWRRRRAWSGIWLRRRLDCIRGLKGNSNAQIPWMDVATVMLGFSKVMVV
jgi:hypothetical protein